MNGIHVPGSNKCNVEDTKGMMLSVHVMKVIVPRCLHVALFRVDFREAIGALKSNK